MKLWENQTSVEDLRNEASRTLNAGLNSIETKAQSKIKQRTDFLKGVMGIAEAGDKIYEYKQNQKQQEQITNDKIAISNNNLERQKALDLVPKMQITEEEKLKQIEKINEDFNKKNQSIVDNLSSNSEGFNFQNKLYVKNLGQTIKESDYSVVKKTEEAQEKVVNQIWAKEADKNLSLIGESTNFSQIKENEAKFIKDINERVLQGKIAVDERDKIYIPAIKAAVSNGNVRAHFNRMDDLASKDIAKDIEYGKTRVAELENDKNYQGLKSRPEWVIKFRNQVEALENAKLNRQIGQFDFDLSRSLTDNVSFLKTQEWYKNAKPEDQIKYEEKFIKNYDDAKSNIKGFLEKKIGSGLVSNEDAEKFAISTNSNSYVLSPVQLQRFVTDIEHNTNNPKQIDKSFNELINEVNGSTLIPENSNKYIKQAINEISVKNPEIGFIYKNKFDGNDLIAERGTNLLMLKQKNNGKLPLEFDTEAKRKERTEFKKNLEGSESWQFYTKNNPQGASSIKDTILDISLITGQKPEDLIDEMLESKKQGIIANNSKNIYASFDKDKITRSEFQKEILSLRENPPEEIIKLNNKEKYRFRTATVQEDENNLLFIMEDKQGGKAFVGKYPKFKIIENIINKRSEHTKQAIQKNQDLMNSFNEEEKFKQKEAFLNDTKKYLK